MYKSHKTKTNSFDSPFRYDKLIIYILCNVWLKIANYILRRSNLKNPTFDRTRFGCRIFDIRRTAVRMSKIRDPKKRASDVKYSTFDENAFKKLWNANCVIVLKCTWEKNLKNKLQCTLKKSLLIVKLRSFQNASI